MYVEALSFTKVRTGTSHQVLLEYVIKHNKKLIKHKFKMHLKVIFKILLRRSKLVQFKFKERKNRFKKEGKSKAKLWTSSKTRFPKKVCRLGYIKRGLARRVNVTRKTNAKRSNSNRKATKSALIKLLNSKKQSHATKRASSHLQQSTDLGLHSKSTIDRGWAWIVMIGGMFATLILGGIQKSIGVLLTEMVSYFDQPVYIVYMVLTVTGFIIIIAAPLSLILCEVFPRRAVVIGGVFVAFVFTSLSSLTFNIYYVIGTLSLGIAINFGFVYGSTIVIISQYFDKYRSLANGLVLSGSSVGILVLPLLIQLLLDQYGVPGTLLLISGIYLNLMVVALIFRPVEWVKLPRISNLHERDISGKKSIVLTSNSFRFLSSTASVNTIRHNSFTFLSSGASVHHRIRCKSFSFISSDLSVNHRIRSKSFSSVSSDLSVPGIKNNSLSFLSSDVSMPGTISSCLDLFDFNKRHKSVVINDNSINFSATSTELDFELGKTDFKVEPMALLSFLHDIKSIILEKLKKMFDFSIFRNLTFRLLALFTFFSFFGYYNFIVFIPAVAKDKNIDAQNRAYLVSLIGIADLVSRTLTGLFANIDLFPRYYILIVAQLVLSLNTIALGWVWEYLILAIQCGVYGLAGGAYVALWNIIIIDFLSLKNLTKALAFLLLFQGLVMSLGPIILGAMKDATGNFFPSIITTGICSLLSSIILLFYPIVKRWEEARCTLTDREAYLS